MAMALNSNNLTVALITRNEMAAVSKVIGDIRQAVPDAEILVVDSSTDRTAEIAQELGARVIKQFPPRGYGPAMDLALRSAGGQVVVTLDCDDTYPAEQIPHLARLVLEDGYDIVDGSRLASKPRAMPWLNYLGNFSFALLGIATVSAAGEGLAQRHESLPQVAHRRAGVPSRTGPPCRSSCSCDRSRWENV